MARRVVLAFALTLGLAPSALAVPVDPQQRIEVEQPSGDTFTARPFGDEWYNGRETASGFTILRNPRSHAWEYAEKGPAGGLRRSGRVVGADSPTGIARHLRDPKQEARAEDLREHQESAPLAEPLGAPALNAPGPLNGGTHHSLVILVQFADQASLGTTPADWHNRFFGPSDSVDDYYDEVSFGNLAFAPATETDGTPNDGVVGWLTLPTNHPNTGSSINSANQQLTADAIKAADPYVDFGSYDTDHSGWLSNDELHITVIPAGWEAASQCGTPSVWGHKWGAGSFSPVVDGVFAGIYYTQFGEKQCDPAGSFGARPPRMATLGVMVHEMGHDLDLPDLYDTDSSTLGGVGYWSVMAHGPWLRLPNTDPGTSPPHPDAFSKSYEGWITPTVATDGTSTLLDAAANPSAIQLRDNPLGVDWLFGSHVGTGEYFLVENRQKTGYDRALPGCGVLVWRIDETQDYLSPNKTEPRRLVELREADADNQPLEAADAFIGARTFNATSTPNSNLYDGTASGVSLSNFSSTCGASMSVDVDGPETAHPPTGSDGAVTTNEDTQYSFTAANFGFADADVGDTFDSIRIDSLPAVGSLKASGVAAAAGSSYAPGSLTYTPAANGCGPSYASFTFSVRDSSGSYDTSPNTMTVHVTCVDDAPTAVNDSKTVTEDASATTIDVLANDTDIDAGTKTVQGVSLAGHGSVAVTNAGADVAYTPASNYCGADSFTYTLNGGSSATVNVTVSCVDDAPVAVNDSKTLNEDASATTIDVRANDFDVDAGPKMIESKTNGGHGQVAIVSAGGDVTYAPDANYCGPDSFTYTLNGGSTATVNVTVTCVDDAPVAVSDSKTVAEDSGANTLDVRSNDTDVDAGPMTISTTGSASHGAVAIITSNTELRYTPALNYCGPDSFTYTLNGGSSATVNVTVSCVDDAPVAVNDSKTLNEDASATTIDVLANDTDIDAGTKSIESKTNAAHGSVAITSSGADLTYTPDANYCGPDSFTYTLNGGSTATVNVTVTCADDAPVAVNDTRSVSEDALAAPLDVRTNDTDVDSGLKAVVGTAGPAHGSVGIVGGDVTYTPASNYCGADSFTYTLNGGSTATVAITVTCVDDAPVAVDDAKTLSENAAATTIDVLANDTDVDAGPKTIGSKTNGTHGTVAITNSGAGLTYAPDANYCGPDSFTYTLNGGSTATVNVTVTCVDAPPVAVNDSKTVDEDASATTIDVLANDTDTDGGAKTIESKANGTHGTVAITNTGADLTYTPDSNYCGSDDFTYTLNGGSTATVNVTVTCIDDAPTAVNDSKTLDEDASATTIDVRTNDTDVDGGTKTIGSKTNGTHGAVAITNSGDDLTYTPDANYCGTDDFTYTLNGGSTGTVNITVTCVDDAPAAVNDTKTLDEDASATTIDVRANDTDIDNGSKTIQSKTNATHGTVAISGAGDDLTYTPNANYCGADSFTYTLNGGSTATVNVTVTCVDDAPAAVNDTKTVNEDASAATVDVLANDTDVDGGTKTIQSKTNGAHGTVTITNNGADLAYSPAANYCGADDFTYTLNAGSTATVNVTVTCVDDPPAAVDDTKTVNEDASATTVDVRPNDTDVDGGAKTIQSKTNGGHGTVAITNAGADLTYTPAANYCGADSFTYTLNGGSTGTVNVTVTCVDDAPTAIDDSKSVTTGASTATTIDVLANDTDPDGGPKTITAKTNGAHGTVAISGAGDDVTYEPDANYCGPDSFTYTLNGGSTATVTITVSCPDVPPVAVNDAKTVREDSAATTIDVRANDTDGDGGPKMVNAKSNGAHGAVAITHSGADVSYKPATNYCGSDSFTYTLNGGSQAAVKITVTCVDDAPVAVDDAGGVTEDGWAIFDVRANDGDVDGGAKTIVSKTEAAHGGTAITAAGAIAYRPDPNYCGADSLTYTLNGGSTATVSIAVACAPEDSPATDTEPPETNLMRGPARKVKTRHRRARVVFKLGSSEPGSTFWCKLDDGKFEECGRKSSYKVKRGRHVFWAIAVDAAGNVDETALKKKFKVVRRR